jgi:predicted DNA-binding protein (MmcQ/YjbR family)
MANNRLFLYLDLLGFEALVKKQSNDYIEHILKTSLSTCTFFEDNREFYRTIYFSDTIIIWLDKDEVKAVDVIGLVHAGTLILHELSFNLVPVRGVILYNEFNVKASEDSKHQLFWGMGLIQAYHMEKKEKWIGITLSTENLRKEIIDVLLSDKEKGVKIIIKKKGVENEFLINPFPYSTMYWNTVDVKKYATYILSELFTYRFIYGTSLMNCDKNDFTSDVAVKYLSTLEFVKKIVPSDCVEWMHSKMMKLDVEKSFDDLTEMLFP